MAKNTYYVVVRGRKTGIFKYWSGLHGAEQHVTNYSNAIYKGKFKTIPDAIRWYQENSDIDEPTLHFDDPHPTTTPIGETIKIIMPVGLQRVYHELVTGFEDFAKLKGFKIKPRITYFSEYVEVRFVVEKNPNLTPDIINRSFLDYIQFVNKDRYTSKRHHNSQIMSDTEAKLFERLDYCKTLPSFHEIINQLTLKLLSNTQTRHPELMVLYQPKGVFNMTRDSFTSTNSNNVQQGHGNQTTNSFNKDNQDYYGELRKLINDIGNTFIDKDGDHSDFGIAATKRASIEIDKTKPNKLKLVEYLQKIKNSFITLGETASTIEKADKAIQIIQNWL